MTGIKTPSKWCGHNSLVECNCKQNFISRATADPQEIDLRPYGWAPGGYICGKCSSCGDSYSGDKRCWNCKTCAEHKRKQWLANPRSKLTKDGVQKILTDLLNDLLEYGNQENSFEVKNVDLVNDKFTVEFDIIIDEDGKVQGFAGY